MKPPVGYVLSGDRRAASGRRGDAAAFLYAVELLADSAGIETFSSTRRYPWGYAQVILAPTIRRVHIFHEGGQAEPAPVQEFDLKFLSGVTRGSESVTVGDTAYLRDFKATTNAWTTSLGSDPAKEDTFYDEALLAVEAHESMDVGAVYQTEVIKACFYSGKMAQLVQALLGYGKPGDDTPDELTEVLAGKVLYDFRWARCHGLTQDEDGNWWLVEISVTNGVLAMRLPLLTESADVRIDVDNDLEQWLETTFGGIPSGKSFRTGADLTADIADGRVFRLATTAEMADYFDKSAFSPTMGWSFSPTGSEAHNTCYAYDGDEVHSYHYKIEILITADTKSAALTEVSTGRLTVKVTAVSPVIPPAIPCGFGDVITGDVYNTPAEELAGADVYPDDAPLACVHLDGVLHVIVANGQAGSGFVYDRHDPDFGSLTGDFYVRTYTTASNRNVSTPLIDPGVTATWSQLNVIETTALQGAQDDGTNGFWAVLLQVTDFYTQVFSGTEIVRVGMRSRDGYSLVRPSYTSVTARPYESGDEFASGVEPWQISQYSAAGFFGGGYQAFVNEEPPFITPGIGQNTSGELEDDGVVTSYPDLEKLSLEDGTQDKIVLFVLPDGTVHEHTTESELAIPSMLGPTAHTAIPGDPPNHHGAMLDSESANTTDTNYTFVGYI